MPPVRVLRQLLQRRVQSEVAPVVAPLAVVGVLADQPAGPALAVATHPPGADRHPARLQPARTALAPADRAPGTGRLRLDQHVGPEAVPAAAGPRHGEVAADGGHVALAALLQAG